MKEAPHPKLHQCRECVALRFERFIERLEAFKDKTGVTPSNADQTVMVKKYTVRPHFRRNPHHLQADEGLKNRVHSYFRNIVTRGPEKRAPMGAPKRRQEAVRPTPPHELPEGVTPS